MPLVVMHVSDTVRRTSHALAAVLLAASSRASTVVDPVRRAGRAALGIAGSEHPLGVLQAVWQWLLAAPRWGSRP